ncbi:hypothetical protein GB931_01925 [Modestobacter sp. I12A-02628]|uniref:FtsX-like permease family protein n=1 Tax=Goekera deserti TaxID=2497753 RepID=A0A7K3WIH9_9ACTN|nr:hypothetical protein [Goekera deserti]MPQ96696.1 hypothetical protein [Goekera deserti]NDI46990.1 hypothetical protein [Goekera deserti]NEL56227.1 hypothetical protein [Goekera deserti]
MKTSTAWLIARPRTSAGRTRALLVAGGAATGGGLLMTAAGVLRVPGQTFEYAADGSYTSFSTGEYSALAVQAGLRPGLLTGILLLVLPSLALTWQAVTTGSARRAAVHEGLRLSGAGPADLRRVAVLEPAVAGVAGGLLAGPVYLLLWLLLHVAAPPSARLLPGLSPWDAASWLVVVVLTALVAGAAGAYAATPRARRPVRAWPRLLTVAAGVAAFIAVVTSPRDLDQRALETTLNCVALTVLALGLLSTGALWVNSRATRLARSGTAVDVLAAGGLRTLAGPAGRTAGTTCVAGLTLGVAGSLTGALLGPDLSLAENVPALVLTCTAALLAVLAAMTAMALAATDDLVTTSRAVASTAALGAEPAVLEQVQRRRLAVVTTGPLVAGTALGGLYGLLDQSLTAVAGALLTIGLSVLLARAITAAVLRVLRPRIARAAAPSWLRVA